MKKIILFLLALCFTTQIYADSFVMIKVDNQQHLQQIFNRQDINVHYCNDNFVLATTKILSDDMILLDEESFVDNELYFIVYCSEGEQSDYINREKNNGEVLYSNSNILIIKPLSINLRPAKNDGMIAIDKKIAKLPKATRDFPVVTEEDSQIRELMNSVNIDSLTATVEYLQSFEERYYNSENSYIAGEWIESKFLEFGLETEKFSFTYQGNAVSPNIIATQWGTTYPDEFVVCGSHLDSYSYSGVCPGADDNATGVAAVIETARILSQYQFERSILYCSFSAEEIGLVGSDAYASYCEDMGYNIVGYFNNDMNGYLNPGDDIHIDLIYPDYVAPIGDYYMNVASVYFPEMQVRHVNFQAGDSDHTSFNRHGYMGIYPFEDYQNYSPYIHSANDLIGPSVNSFEMSQRYTQMNLACVATLSGMAAAGESEIEISVEVLGSYSAKVSVQQNEYTSEYHCMVMTAEEYNAMNEDEVLDLLLTTTEAMTGAEVIFEDLTEDTEYYAIACGLNTLGQPGNIVTADFTTEPDALGEIVDNKFSINPNPATSMLNIKSDMRGEADINIIDMTGRCVLSVKVDNISNTTLNVDELKSGIYFININGKVEKLVIE